MIRNQLPAQAVKPENSSTRRGTFASIRLNLYEFAASGEIVGKVLLSFERGVPVIARKFANKLDSRARIRGERIRIYANYSV